MALAAAYARPRHPIDVLVLAHYDAHGVSFAAARYRVLRLQNLSVVAEAQYPVTGPQGLSSGQIKQVLDKLHIAPRRIEVIDIPLDVRNPDASIKTLADLAQSAIVYYYDHHETDVPFIPRLHQNGIYASVFGDNVAMAAALELLSDDVARELAIVGMVADRDSSVLKLVSRQEVEEKYLPLANKLDVIVRNPQQVNMLNLAAVITVLAEEGVEWLKTINIDYPPEQLAKEIASKVVEQGSIALLVDWSDMPQQYSQWVPKTLEQLSIISNKPLVIAVVPGINPRTKQVEGWDVRILRYWLAPADTPMPEQIAKDLIQAKAISGQVVGHADYISLRYSSLDEALQTARRLYRTIEGMEPQAAHLVNDKYVAEAIRRDFQAILERLTEILEQQKKMYEEYLELKRKQVELLERTQRHEYD